MFILKQSITVDGKTEEESKFFGHVAVLVECSRVLAAARSLGNSEQDINEFKDEIQEATNIRLPG